MKLLVLICTIYTFQVSAQLLEKNKRGPCIDTFVKHVYILNRISFLPLNNESNKTESSLFLCNNYRFFYFLEGLEISEKKFLALNIKQKNVIKNRTWYEYQYQNNDTTNCVESCRLFLSINIPIKLNGIILKSNEKESALKKILPEQIVAINFKKYLFRKGFVEVITT